MLVLLPAVSRAWVPSDLHEIRWYVHTDLVSGGLDLAYYESMIDVALVETHLALQGSQGPVDEICCSTLVKKEHSPGVTLALFGSANDGLDVMDFGDFATYSGIGGSGSRILLVDSINYCAGGPALGCAQFPGCDGTPDDDPNRILIVTLEADERGVLGLVIAHERGHNACLQHVAANSCELMQNTVNGGCISVSECSDYQAARTSTGSEGCSCHTGGGAIESDGTICSEAAVTGVCSGGSCGAQQGDAGIQLFAAGGPEAASGAITNDALQISALPGGWTLTGPLGDTLKGLANDSDSATLYGIADRAGDDELVVVDAPTGQVLYSIGPIVGHQDVIALAFDPGATAGSGDDRLFALSSATSVETLIEINPVSALTTVLGQLSLSVAGGFQGLAFDSLHAKLYASGDLGGNLWEIDEASCANPSTCSMSEVLAVNLPRIDSGLAFSPQTGNLYLVGRSPNGAIVYNSIDATTLGSTPNMGVDPFTIGALAAIPVPEPSPTVFLPAGIVLLTLLARRRARMNTGRVIGIRRARDGEVPPALIAAAQRAADAYRPPPHPEDGARCLADRSRGVAGRSQRPAGREGCRDRCAAAGEYGAAVCERCGDCRPAAGRPGSESRKHRIAPAPRTGRRSGRTSRETRGQGRDSQPCAPCVVEFRLRRRTNIPTRQPMRWLKREHGPQRNMRRPSEVQTARTRSSYARAASGRR